MGLLLNQNGAPLRTIRKPIERTVISARLKVCRSSICDTARSIRPYTAGKDFSSAISEEVHDMDEILPGFRRFECSIYELEYLKSELTPFV